MTLPTISLNGTKKEILVQDLADASSALRKAIEALVKTKPHGRDYLDAGTFAKARAEYDARDKALFAVFAELVDLTEKIDEIE